MLPPLGHELPEDKSALVGTKVLGNAGGNFDKVHLPHPLSSNGTTAPLSNLVSDSETSDEDGSDHSCDDEDDDNDGYGPHPGHLFEKEVVRLEKRLRPFIGTNEQLLKLTRGGCRNGGRNDGGRRSRADSNVFEGEASCIDRRLLRASAPAAKGVRSSLLLPPVDSRRGSMAGRRNSSAPNPSTVGKRRRQSSMLTVAAGTSGYGSQQRSSILPTPSQAAQSGRKLPDVLSCGTKELPDMSPAQTTDSNISTGLREYAAGNFIAAVTRLDRAIEQHPTAFVPRFVRGLCYDKLCRNEAALRDFSLCCDASRIECESTISAGGPGRGGDRRSIAYFNRGVVRTKTNDLDGAMKDFTTAIAMNAFEPHFYTNRALLHRRRGDFEAAQRDYRLLRRIVEGQNRRSTISTHQSPSDRSLRSMNGSGRDRPSSTARQQGTFVRSGPIGNHHHPATLPESSRSPLRKRPKSSSCDVDPHSTVFGHVHGALTCPARKRTDTQLDILVRESEMMSAFVHCHNDELRTLWRYLEYRKFPSNIRIFEQGDPAEDYYLVWTGCVSARVRKENGAIRHANIAKALALETEFTVNTMTAGETLGEAVLEDDGFRRATCVTEEPTELLVLRKEHFDMTFKKFLEREHEEKVDFLAGIGCFAGWARDTLSKAAKYCRERTYREGEVIVSQDAPADSIFFIRSGLVSMLRTLTVDVGGVGGGDNVNNEQQEEEEHSIECEVCVAKICAGDVFGEATVLDPEGLGVFHSSAVCETQTVCYRLDRVQIKSNEWDAATIAALEGIAVVYPEDSILLQAHIDHLQFKKRSSQIMKKFWGKQDPKKRLCARSGRER